MNQSMMKAVRVHKYGGPEVMGVDEIERPKPQSQEVLIRIVFAPCLPVDYKIRNGWLQGVFPKTLPYIAGAFMSGIVEEVGAQVTDMYKGDRVFGQVNGSYAEYCVARAEDLVRMPDTLSFEDAATIKGGAESAWKALFTEGDLHKGQTVLIHGAAGGVGQFAVQLAKWRGARVIGTASEANVDFVKSLGADQVINYQTERFEDVVKEVDLVVDLVGGDTEERSWVVLKQGGIFVSLTGVPSQEKAAAKGITAKFNSKIPSKQDTKAIAQLIADGTIQAEIDSIYSLEEAKEALRKSEARHGRGRLLIRVAQL